MYPLICKELAPTSALVVAMAPGPAAIVEIVQFKHSWTSKSARIRPPPFAKNCPEAVHINSALNVNLAGTDHDEFGR